MEVEEGSAFKEVVTRVARVVFPEPGIPDIAIKSR